MRLILEELTELYAKEICNWKYDGEYSIYNYPSWTKVLDDKWAITIEEKRKKEFFAVIDEEYKLCGYIRLQEKNECILVGVGLKPYLCGQRLGDTLMEIVKQQCANLYPSKIVALEVRSFNERAIKCYKRAGFIVKEIYKKDTPIGYGEFIRMEFIC
ncbi:GNAT family N-acetyltransferase [Clostridium beijerinckii]|uniref:Ribosomal protein S18 acetylase RimI-like enzyme n=1 Tax=Clostridium beijerinckii TaxID=1520 RepID=A0AAE5LP91_CLOBE|nr:GNAT family N-acetyltransferase [Clostridium beijerinckii]NSB13446.1 ribosomal protein S18 acetylase RimI-like enzyme [Clostridium beijerinckii]OOM28364.1 acetyltransferase (GNAT) family protein [Clostridium beijerinckii]